MSSELIKKKHLMSPFPAPKKSILFGISIFLILWFCFTIINSLDFCGIPEKFRLSSILNGLLYGYPIIVTTAITATALPMSAYIKKVRKPSVVTRNFKPLLLVSLICLIWTYGGYYFRYYEYRDYQSSKSSFIFPEEIDIIPDNENLTFRVYIEQTPSFSTEVYATVSLTESYNQM